MERLIVDRIEEGFVILEKEDFSHISLSLLSFGFSVKEGDVLLFDGEKYAKDDKERDKRRQKLLSIQEKLKEKSKNK